MGAAQKLFGGDDSVDWTVLFILVTLEPNTGLGCNKSPEAWEACKMEPERWACNPRIWEAEPGGWKIIV